jgi:MerR family redox-sensitive transcriptional activator SoxR
VGRRAGVRPSQLRYYERIGLLPTPERLSGQRRYDETVLRRLAVIQVVQRAGFSLEEIGGLVRAGSEPISEQLSELAQRKLPEIDALIDRAQRVRMWLEAAARCECHTIDDCELFDETPPPSTEDAQQLRLAPGGAVIHP